MQRKPRAARGSQPSQPSQSSQFESAEATSRKPAKAFAKLNPYQRQKAEISRRCAKQEKCPSCGAPVLHGPDNETGFWMVRVDPAIVTRTQELQAVLAGLMSYTIEHHGAGPELTIRLFVEWPASYPVVLEHVCTTRFKEK